MAPMEKKANVPSLSVFFPAYNEQENIGPLLDEALKIVPKLADDFEIIIVNDGSSDKTGEIVRQYVKKNRKIRLVEHRENQGYGAAVWSGFKAAKKDVVFFCDSDRQFKLSELKNFLILLRDHDVVIGYRKPRRDPVMRLLNAKGWKALLYLLFGLKIKDIDCAFKAFKREALRGIEIKSRGAMLSAELIYRLSKKGASIAQIPVGHYPRRAGRATGANLKVITKAFRELWEVYRGEKELVRTRSIFVYILAAIVLFLSRLAFISHSPDFFDSTQYVYRATLPTFKEIVTTGHPPFHPLYVLFSAFFYRIGFHDATYAATLPSVVFGCGSIILVYLLSRRFFSNKVAYLATIIYTLIPFVWISQITVLVDPVEHFFYFLSLYLFALCFDRRRASYLISILAGVSFGLAAFTHTQVAIWALGIISIAILSLKNLSPKTLKQTLIYLILFVLSALVFVLPYLKIMTLASSTRSDFDFHSYRSALKYLVLGNAGDHQPFSLMAAKSYLLEIASVPVAILAFLGMIEMLWKEWKKALALLLWLVPASIVASSYIYENLHGRALIIGLVPLSVFAAYFILRRRFSIASILTILVLAQLLVISWPAVWRYHSLPAPNISLSQLQKASLPQGTFISSNVTRTWSNYTGSFISFGDVGSGAAVAQASAKKSFSENRPVYVSSDAIYHPFWRYDGQYFDLRSIQTGDANGHITLLDSFFKNYYFVLDRINNYGFKQAVYKVTDQKPTDYLEGIEKALPNSAIVFGRIVSSSKGNPVSNVSANLYAPLRCNAVSENITKFDFAYCLKRIILKSQDPVDWSFSDANGWFFIQNPVQNSHLVLGISPSQVKLEEPKGSFAKKESRDIAGELVATYDNLKDVKQAISQNNGSFYVLASLNSGKMKFEFYRFDFDLTPTNMIEAEDLSGEKGQVVADKGASGQLVRESKADEKGGYLVAGPYLDLDPGKYRVSFTVKSAEQVSAEVKFDVVSDSAVVSHALKEMPLSDIARDKFQEIPLEFSISKPTTGFEFRVYVPANIKVEIDYIKLEKVD